MRSGKWGFSEKYYQNSLNTLNTSLSSIPAYQKWKPYDPGPEYDVDTRFQSLPVLYKKQIRENFPEGLIPPGRDVNQALENGEISLAHTSGSSDISATNIWNQQWWDASERGSWKLNSFAHKIATGTHHEAILANPLNVGISSDNGYLSMDERRLSRFLFLNEKTDPSQWTDKHMDRMIEELEIFRPVVLEANPSFLARLSRYAIKHDKKVYQPGLIVFTYEYPTRFHYRQISQVFNSPTASSYGSTETGYVFMQCEEGKFHQNTDFCRVDIQPLKREYGDSETGRIIITTFNNPWYYMLRFDIRDLARIDSSGKCACGRNSGLILSAIEGRVISLTLTCDGKPVTLRTLDDAMGVLTDIDEYRLDQIDSTRYILTLVSQNPAKEKLAADAKDILHTVYGEKAEISVKYAEALSPEDSGKYSIARAVFPVNVEDFLDEDYLVRVS
ncbi:MAG TPA: phenylacetate--CoA ligase family protein [Dehalococcoidia bacterium]|nr:phenylacetate--CoA ligase family protein [Dehalococcoidia bacterium]